MNTADQMHRDLFERSLQHQAEHQAEYGAADTQTCTVFPSPQAPLWATIASALPATRVLEIGCGIGYQTACIASANPDCAIETIENVPVHADLARDEFERLGIADRITILRADAETLLPGLDDPYDLIIVDAAIDYDRWLPDLTRLARPGGVLITGNLAGKLPNWDPRLPTGAAMIVRPQFSY